MMAVWRILKRQSRRPLMPALVIAQVALACAITCNALFLLGQQLAPVIANDGIGDPSHLIYIQNLNSRGNPWTATRMRQVSAELSALPGISEVSNAATLPMTAGSQLTEDVQLGNGQGKASVALYAGDNLVKTLSLRVAQGRDFDANEKAANLDLGGIVGQQFHSAIITQALARRVFPNGNAVGNLLPGSNTRIVGIIEKFPGTGGAQEGTPRDEAIIAPAVIDQWQAPTFAVRTTNPATDSTCQGLVTAVKKDIGNEMVPGFEMSCDTFTSVRSKAMAAPLAAVWLLAGVTLIVLIVTITGIVGMTSYWVQQRTRSIGVCRALGATRMDVVREILMENAIVVALGSLLGLLAAYGINIWLMRHFELQHLPYGYFPMGALILLALGLVSAIAPARRAANIAPIVATRAA